ncbi:MAG: M3 family peptidase [Alphaproteobacteria bacterium HGW-Alphaproteobacteria-17]|nr:MAG: M3 family peptidase [Alphaproteobacteria bacterium HGW-Alphaproteobacteria-17]
MPQSAPRLARKLSIMLASTAMMVGYSQMSTAVAAEPAAKTVPAGQNPMLAPWTGPYEGVPPWDKLDPELFPDAFQKAMDEVKAEVQAVIDNPAAPTFDNTHVPMQLAGDTIQRIYALWGVQTSNRSNDRVEAIDAEWSPKLSKFFTELYLDPKLFARYKAVYDARNTSGLDAQQIRIVERSYEEMVRDGANLSPADKAKLVEINSKLEGHFSSFSSKLLGDEKLYTFVTDKAELDGLEPAFVASLAAAATEQGKPGQWAIKNTRSSAQPVLQGATNRGLREKVWRAFVGRGDNGDANDTKAVIADVLKLRQQRAELLGFPTHAHYRMADTMAKTPENADALMMKVWPAAVARVKEEVADMQAIADAEAKAGKGPKITIEPWDYRFYAEKVRKAKYDLDESEVKPYFQLDKLVDGMFWAAGELYDMGFKENTGTIPVFDPKVRTFEVFNLKTNKPIGVFYLDNFARDGKRSGAWMTTYRSQQKLGGERNVLASNNNNFTEAAKGEPTLISIDDAQTLFHEFGHGIHFLLYDITYPALAGVPRDFVEYPSQVNENWLMTPEVLSKFATHYQTGEPIPQALVDKILASDTFNQGFSTVEYLASAIVDMKLHNRKVPPTDIAKFERETLAEIGMPKEIVMRHRLPQFGHLFSSDSYSAGYYSYLWSETMDADTWAAFNEAGGPWDRTIADKFRTLLLMTGNETDRAEAYRAFRGRDPDVKALLKKRGFPTE